jgi:nucleoside recognition membrane protein YjiH
MQVFINMAITIIGAIITVFTAFRSGLSPKVIWPTLTMLGTRASQVYTTATMQRSMIEKTMQKLLYDRTVASQEAVLSTLTEEMAR